MRLQVFLTVQIRIQDLKIISGIYASNEVMIFCHDRHSTRGSSFLNYQWPGRRFINIDPFQPMDLLNTNDGHPFIDVDCPLRILVAALTAPSPVFRTKLERVDITKAVQFGVVSLRGVQNAMLSAPDGITLGRRNQKSVIIAVKYI